MKKQISSKLAFAYAVFAAFLPLTFNFNNGKSNFLIDSPTGPAWCFLAWGIAIYLLIHFRASIGNRKLMALAILYLAIPFTFRWSAEGFTFIILRSSWILAVALATMGIFFLRQALRTGNQENQS